MIYFGLEKKILEPVYRENGFDFLIFVLKPTETSAFNFRSSQNCGNQHQTGLQLYYI